MRTNKELTMTIQLIPSRQGNHEYESMRMNPGQWRRKGLSKYSMGGGGG